MQSKSELRAQDTLPQMGKKKPKDGRAYPTLPLLLREYNIQDFQPQRNKKNLERQMEQASMAVLQKESNLNFFVFFSSNPKYLDLLGFGTQFLLFSLVFVLLWLNLQVLLFGFVCLHTCTQHKSTRSTHQLLIKPNQI